MRTLYLRNVPDDVATRLEGLAAEARMSLNAYLVEHLDESSRMAENARLLASLPSFPAITRDDILEDVRSARGDP